MAFLQLQHDVRHLVRAMYYKTNDKQQAIGNYCMYRTYTFLITSECDTCWLWVKKKKKQFLCFFFTYLFYLFFLSSTITLPLLLLLLIYIKIIGYILEHLYVLHY